MNTIVRHFTILFLSCICFCSVMMDNPASPYPGDHPYTPDTPSKQRITRNISGFFPFEDNSNAWAYTEAGGNKVTILVTDTISDDNVTYFRVSFRENRVDTTDDWFSRSTRGIYFSQSLTGNYELFLPEAIDSLQGKFESAGAVSYAYHDSLLVNGTLFRRALHLRYQSPIIHGFDEITLVESIGIVELVDHSGRWPIYYEIESCQVGGNSRKF
jgi:hypothetical protein